MKNVDKPLFETYIMRLTKNVLNEYLDKNVMMPLKKYIDKASKLYCQNKIEMVMS